MPTKNFMSLSFAGATLCHLQGRLRATQDLSLMAMQDFNLAKVCSLDDYRAAYGTLAALLAALALHNTPKQGSRWELTVSKEVQAYCTEDELLTWARDADCAMALLIGYELTWGYWDGRLKGLPQHAIVYPTIKQLGGLALGTQDMPLVRPAEQAASTIQRRLKDAVSLYTGRFGTVPSNLPLIETILAALERAQAFVALQPGR